MTAPSRRTSEEIVAALMAGELDIGDLHLTVRTQVDEIDKSGDVQQLVRTRIYEDGQQVEVMNFSNKESL